MGQLRPKQNEQVEYTRRNSAPLEESEKSDSSAKISRAFINGEIRSEERSTEQFLSDGKLAFRLNGD